MQDKSGHLFIQSKTQTSHERGEAGLGTAGQGGSGMARRVVAQGGEAGRERDKGGAKRFDQRTNFQFDTQNSNNLSP